MRPIAPAKTTSPVKMTSSPSALTDSSVEPSVWPGAAIAVTLSPATVTTVPAVRGTTSAGACHPSSSGAIICANCGPSVSPGALTR